MWVQFVEYDVNSRYVPVGHFSSGSANWNCEL